MQALSSLPQVNIKLSMMDYIRPGWQKHDEGKVVIRDLVREVSEVWQVMEVLAPALCSCIILSHTFISSGDWSVRSIKVYVRQQFPCGWLHSRNNLW